MTYAATVKGLTLGRGVGFMQLLVSANKVDILPSRETNQNSNFRWKLQCTLYIT
jgi:hypothetical protein